MKDEKKKRKTGGKSEGHEGETGNETEGMEDEGEIDDKRKRQKERT